MTEDEANKIIKIARAKEDEQMAVDPIKTLDDIHGQMLEAGPLTGRTKTGTSGELAKHERPA